MDIKPAIVVIGYNRPDSTKRLLLSIGNAFYPVKDVTLIISIDKSDKSDLVEQVADEFRWEYGEKIIKKHEKRLGLKEHVLKCGDLSLDYGAIIVLEDDLIVSRCFYSYILQCIRYYKDQKKVTGFALYSHAWNGYANYEFMPQKNEYDVYMGQFSITWGQCWTREQWKRFRQWYEEKKSIPLSKNYQIPKKIEQWGKQSWGKYFVYFLVEKDLYYVIPYVSLSTNCSDVGEHNSIINNSHQVMMMAAKDYEYRLSGFLESIKYDVFFERIFDGAMLINGIHANEICVDLNQTKRRYTQNYVLTTRKLLKSKIIEEYGLQLRPIEENVVNKIPGRGIFLYHIINKEKRHLLKTSIGKRAEYELYDTPWNVSFLYSLIRLKLDIRVLLIRAKRVIKRIIGI